MRFLWVLGLLTVVQTGFSAPSLGVEKVEVPPSKFASYSDSVSSDEGRFRTVPLEIPPTPAPDGKPADSPPTPPKAWYEKVQFKGYAQLRYNRLFETNPLLTCDQCDKSWGTNQSFTFRRARFVFSGSPNERLSFYIQTDLASDVSNPLQAFLQVRDLYADLYLDEGKEFRVRPGWSKVPFGWDNLQSSSMRLALDRTDAVNSAAPGERDLGVFAYWSPKGAQDRFKQLADRVMKGTGDYGVVGFGTYVGQSGLRREANNNLHVAARVTYPWLLGEQFLETSLQAYGGQFAVSRNAGVAGEANYEDRRVAASLVLYPQPFGLQLEYLYGEGPEYDVPTSSVRLKELQGGYVLVNYRIALGQHLLIPFVRAQYFRGGKKHETDARSYEVREYEGGMEWHPHPALELTAAYVSSARRYEDKVSVGNVQEGQLLRLQCQFNY